MSDALLASPSCPPPGGVPRTLGGYQVLAPLAQGGMSSLYLAALPGPAGFRKLVALKVIHPSLAVEADGVRMFLEEARLGAALHHPHLAQVFHLGAQDGLLFMAQEWVQGCSLLELARACHARGLAIPLDVTLRAVAEAARALHHAHTFVDARGRSCPLIHRDVAPKNVMVTYLGVTKLVDFGIARVLQSAGHTASGLVKGTSGYLSPEQARGEALDARTDVFSLGVVLHECLTGRRLFPRGAPRAVLEAAIPPPSRVRRHVPPALDAVVLRALERPREARFPTALDLAQALERDVGHLFSPPESSGALVASLFSARREALRGLLEEASRGEVSGDVPVEDFLRRLAVPPARRLRLVTPPPQALPATRPDAPRPAAWPRRPRVGLLALGLLAATAGAGLGLWAHGG